MDTFIRTAAKIELLLNPMEADHQRLQTLIIDAIAMLQKSQIDSDLKERIDHTVAQILEAGQVTLKREWVRVKSGR